jgi:hypothetical protein
MKLLVLGPDRLEVRSVKCPECGAWAGYPCFGTKKDENGRSKRRVANHLSRVKAYIRSKS